MWRHPSDRIGLGTRVRFILIGTAGSLAEFDTWEAAYQFMSENPGQGSIVRSETPLDPGPFAQPPGSMTIPMGLPQGSGSGDSVSKIVSNSLGIG
jgi:hypothetical protein